MQLAQTLQNGFREVAKKKVLERRRQKHDSNLGTPGTRLNQGERKIYGRSMSTYFRPVNAI